LEVLFQSSASGGEIATHDHAGNSGPISDCLKIAKIYFSAPAKRISVCGTISLIMARIFKISNGVGGLRFSSGVPGRDLRYLRNRINAKITENKNHLQPLFRRFTQAENAPGTKAQPASFIMLRVLIFSAME